MVIEALHRPCDSGRHEEGFSLFELIVVLVLLGLVAAVILPSFTNGMEGIRLNAAARDMVTKLKQARSRAISEQRVFRVAFGSAEQEESAYSITDDYGVEVEKIKLPRGFKLILDPDSEPVVSFYPNGQSSGFQLLIQNRRDYRLAVEVDRISGLAKARRPDKEG